MNYYRQLYSLIFFFKVEVQNQMDLMLRHIIAPNSKSFYATSSKMHLCALATSKSEIHMIFRGLHNLKMLLAAFAYLLCDHKKLGAWELVLAVSLS